MPAIDKITGKPEAPLPGQPVNAPPVRARGGIGRRILSRVRSSEPMPKSSVGPGQSSFLPPGEDEPTRKLDHAYQMMEESGTTDPGARRRIFDRFAAEPKAEETGPPAGGYLHPEHPMIQDHASRLQAIEDKLGIGKGSGRGAGGGGGDAY